MTDTGASIHHVVFDAQRQRYQGAVTFGPTRDIEVSVPGHRAWSYRQIANAIVAAGRRHTVKGPRHDCA